MIEQMEKAKKLFFELYAIVTDLDQNSFADELDELETMAEEFLEHVTETVEMYD